MTLTKKDKEDIREIFNEGLEQLVLPQLDAIYGKLEEHDKRLDGLEDGQDKMLRKLTQIEDRLDDHAETLSKHEQTITVLEKKVRT